MFNSLQIPLLRLPTALLMWALILSSAPCGPATIDFPTDTPDAAEIALIEDLLVWLADDPSDSLAGAPGFSAKSEPLRQAIRNRRSSFDLFREYHDRETRHAALSVFPYGKMMRQAAEAHSLDGLLLAAIVQVESGFDPSAVSPRGAVGLMQLMPENIRDHGVEELLDPATNLGVGAAYLSWLLDHFDGNLELALAAYNAGPTTVERYGGVPPFRETRDFLDKVLHAYFGLHQEVWLATADGELLATL